MAKKVHNIRFYRSSLQNCEWAREQGHMFFSSTFSNRRGEAMPSYSINPECKQYVSKNCELCWWSPAPIVAYLPRLCEHSRFAREFDFFSLWLEKAPTGVFLQVRNGLSAAENCNGLLFYENNRVLRDGSIWHFLLGQWSRSSLGNSVSLRRTWGAGCNKIIWGRWELQQL